MTRAARRDGGYDEGYAKCSHLWGLEPGSLVRRVFDGRDPSGLAVLDAGCGDGKNALWLAARGATVLALDISALALARAREHDSERNVSWVRASAAHLPLGHVKFDVVIAYGLLHCLASRDEVRSVVRELQAWTRAGGMHLTVAFNDRDQDLGQAHPNFDPALLAHEDYLEAYEGWIVDHASDELLFETHPHNKIPHHHSMTRIIARKPQA